MNSINLISSPSPPQITISPSIHFTKPPKLTSFIQLNPIKKHPTKSLSVISLNYTNPPFSRKLCDYNSRIITPCPNNVAQKIESLVAEFKSLTQPIDRVKRLLDYATRLPFFDESARSPENRVTGCTAQLWLEVRMDVEGLMRFRVDSDSEITKGFCSCLIWLLDGAAPEEVVAVKAEDLAEMNVGILPANSRVNTWNTVLLSMQKRTKALVAERYARLAVAPPPPPPHNMEACSTKCLHY